MSAIVLGELRSGFLKGSSTKKNAVDDGTSERCAAIYDYVRRQGTPVSPNDLWVAASAAQHGLRIVTSNGDFDRIPHVIVDLFDPQDRSS